MKILILRHGETDWNRAELIQGRTDNPLNERGKEQAKATFRHIIEHKPQIILSSPLKRAIETATLMREEFEIQTGEKAPPLVIEPLAIERNFGEYEGTTYEQACLNALRKWEDNEYGGAFVPGGEQNRDIVERAEKLFKKIKKGETGEYSEYLNYKFDTTILVGHGAFLRGIFWYYNYPPKAGSEFHADNCSLTPYDV